MWQLDFDERPCRVCAAAGFPWLAATHSASACAQRHRDRMPLQLRDVYSRLAACRTEQERQALHKTARTQRAAWLARLELGRICKRIRRGHVLTKSKKLHRVTRMVVDGLATADESQWEMPSRMFLRRSGDHTAYRNELTFWIVFRELRARVSFFLLGNGWTRVGPVIVFGDWMTAGFALTPLDSAS